MRVREARYLAERVLAPGVDKPVDTLLQVVRQLLEGVDGVVDVLRSLEITPEAHLSNHVEAFSLHRRQHG